MIKRIFRMFADVFIGGRCCSSCNCWNSGKEDSNEKTRV